MKLEKCLLPLAVLCVLSFTTACGGDDSELVQPSEKPTQPSEPEEPEGPALTEGITTQSFYKGDYYKKGTGNYWINFEVEIEKSNPHVLCLDFNGTLSENPDFAQLPVGDYVVGDGSYSAAFTMNLDGDSYLMRYDDDGFEEYIDVTGGKFTLSMESGVYKAQVSVTLDGGEAYALDYCGPIIFYNRTDEGNMSNLTQDMELTFTQGLAIYYGDIYETGSEAWNVVLAEADYDLSINFGKGDAVQLAFNGEAGKSDYIPNGKYTLIDPNTADSFPKGTMLAGLYDTTYGGYWGCWYYSTRRMLEARFDTGSAEVSRSGETYTLKLELKDRAGHTVRSTYTGKLKRIADE